MTSIGVSNLNFRHYRLSSRGLGRLFQTTMNPWLLSIPLAYLLGSIPFGYLLVKIFLHQDIRATGSGNIGATNVARSGAKGLAVVAAVAAILGHVFPVWLGFRGGKGVASALGVFLALSPAAAGCTFAIFLVIFLLTRYVSLASIIGSALFPLFGLYFAPQRTPIVIAGFLFIPLLIIFKHHENIRRLLHGTENRFGKK